MAQKQRRTVDLGFREERKCDDAESRDWKRDDRARIRGEKKQEKRSKSDTFETIKRGSIIMVIPLVSRQPRQKSPTPIAH